ncbi:response regulator [Candidatus Dependentiae bacterium]|nr:response regulator [Candidatus Dependentiae bacterium]
MKKDDFSLTTFKDAIKLFHSLSYEGKEFPQGMYSKTLAEIEISETLSDLLYVLEKFNPDFDPFDWGKKIKIAIGCDKFPFLKLVLQESPIKGEYGFLVDRHSEFLGHKVSISYEKEVELKKYLNDLKNKIEDIFYENHLPSYKYLIKKYIDENSQDIPSSERKGSILLAEDEPDVHDLYKMELEIIGYSVCSAYSGEDALDMVDESDFSCVVLDLMMPNVSGLDVLEAIGKEHKCIILSALADDNTKETCKNLGAAAYLEKPAEQTELEITIEKVRKGEHLI